MTHWLTRAKIRGLYNVLGCAVFAVLYFLLPQSLHPYLGILGGIGVGYSAGYAWQTVFNTFGALYIASGAFGLVGAIVLRIGTNVGAAAYTMLLDQILNRLFGREMKRREGYQNVAWYKQNSSAFPLSHNRATFGKRRNQRRVFGLGDS